MIKLEVLYYILKCERNKIKYWYFLQTSRWVKYIIKNIAYCVIMKNGSFQTENKMKYYKT